MTKNLTDRPADPRDALFDAEDGIAKLFGRGDDGLGLPGHGFILRA
jgi:hypothetical protein